MAKVEDEDKADENDDDDDNGDSDGDGNDDDDVSSLIASKCLKSMRNSCAAQELRGFLSPLTFLLLLLLQVLLLFAVQVN